jgi:hypothetical protein
VRYYNLLIEGDTSAQYSSTIGGSIGGQYDPGGLQIEFDATVYTFDDPVDNAKITVWGVSLPTISQASNFNGATVTLSAGMSAGLPLAKPSQAGVILKGKVFQAFGNWTDTKQTLDLIVYADAGATQDSPANIVVNWTKGQKMGDMIESALLTAFPSYTVNVGISDSLVLAEADAHYVETLAQFSAYCYETSKSINSDPNYLGVKITLSGTTFTVFDGTVDSGGNSQSNPTLIDFDDMIGQPTWLGPATVQTYFVMRADLSVGSYIQFPPAQTTSTAAEQTLQAKDKSSFQGVFLVTRVRHVGNLRGPNAADWITVVDSVSNPAPAS